MRDEWTKLSVAGGGLLIGGITFLTSAPPVFYSISTFIFGIGVSQLSNSRKDRTARKHEADLKMNAEIYNPIYQDLTQIIRMRSGEPIGYRSYDGTHWDDIRNNAFSTKIPRDLEKRIDNLFALLNTVNGRARKLRLLPLPRLKSNIRKALGQDIRDFNVYVTFVSDGVKSRLSPTDVNREILRGLNPIEAAKRDIPAESYSMAFDVDRGAGYTGEKIDQDILLHIFTDTIKEVKEDPAYKDLVADESEMIATCTTLRQEVGEMITRPTFER